jgi:hypothetical protein
MESLEDVLAAMKSEDVPMWRLVTRAVRRDLAIEGESMEAGFRRQIEELEDRRDWLEQEIETR